jgi:hypothetical protein
MSGKPSSVQSYAAAALSGAIAADVTLNVTILTGNPVAGGAAGGAVGGGVGSALDDFANGKPIDVPKAAVSAGVGAAIGGIVNIKAIKAITDKAVNSVSKQMFTKLARGIIRHVVNATDLKMLGGKIVGGALGKEATSIVKGLMKKAESIFTSPANKSKPVLDKK